MILKDNNLQTMMWEADLRCEKEEMMSYIAQVKERIGFIYKKTLWKTHNKSLVSNAIYNKCINFFGKKHSQEIIDFIAEKKKIILIEKWGIETRGVRDLVTNFKIEIIALVMQRSRFTFSLKLCCKIYFKDTKNIRMRDGMSYFLYEVLEKISQTFSNYFNLPRPYRCHIFKKCCPQIKEIRQEEGRFRNKIKACLFYDFTYPDKIKNRLKKILKDFSIILFDSKDLNIEETKSCQICKLITVSDFGIALLSPLNYNVFLEIGWLQAMGKPVIFLVDEKMLNTGKIPFNLDDRLVVTFRNWGELEAGVIKKCLKYMNN